MDSRREQEARNEAGIRDRNEWIQRTNAQMVANGAGLDSPARRIVRETEPGRGLPQ